MRATCCFLLLCLIVGCSQTTETTSRPYIKVGVLHSQSGPYANPERVLLNSALLAIDEINAAGGILGCHIKPILADGASDTAVFAKEAYRLIHEEHVVAIFGCMTSDSRRAVKPIVEAAGSVLFYPVACEGLEQSPNTIYMGSSPNHSVIPAVQWASMHLGKRFLLLGYESLFSYALGAIMADHIAALGGEVVAQVYSDRTRHTYEDVINCIEQHKPDVIITTQGNTLNKLLLSTLAQAPQHISDLPVFVFGENKLMGSPLMRGHYVTSYCNERTMSQHFTESYRYHYGSSDAMRGSMASAYAAVHLWARSAVACKSAEPSAVLAAIPNQSIQGPMGLVYLAPDNLHAYQTVTISRIQDDGSVQVLWDSQVPLAPEPYPPFRTAHAWDAFVSTVNVPFELAMGM